MAGTIRAPPVAAEISAPTSMDDFSLDYDFPSTASGALAVVVSSLILFLLLIILPLQTLY